MWRNITEPADGKGQKIMNPETIIEVGENSYMEMDTAQIKGVDSTIRKTTAKLAEHASLKVMERLMTHGNQKAESRFYRRYEWRGFRS